MAQRQKQWRRHEIAPRDEDDRETIAEFLGDDSLQSAGYCLYAMFGAPAAIPVEEKINRQIEESGLLDIPNLGDRFTQIAIQHRKLEAKQKRASQPIKFGWRAINRRKRMSW